MMEFERNVVDERVRWNEIEKRKMECVANGEAFDRFKYSRRQCDAKVVGKEVVWVEIGIMQFDNFEGTFVKHGIELFPGPRR